ncbi:MAG: class I SAM-dependent methyltransferase [Mycobacteriales bacterium]
MSVDEQRLNEFMGQAVTDHGAAISIALTYLGDELGLYKALDGAGPLTAPQVAERTGTDARLVREWLSNQAAGGYVAYDPATDTFTLPDEQAFALAQDESPAFLPGFSQVVVSIYRDLDKLIAAFRSGGALGWHEHDTSLFHGTERFFRPGYAANLVSAWIPALDGIDAKLRGGASVADVGCGHGASTIVMAQAYPKSTFVGYDYHAPSIEAARKAAADAGVADRVRFEVASAKDYPGSGYDLVAFFDCLHDMGDPVGAARHVRSTLAPDGTWLLVEPFANDRLEDNLNPVGRVFYGASTVICTPASKAQEVGLALGAQAGEARTREVVTGAGFGTFRRATETPFNLVYEAKP